MKNVLKNARVNVTVKEKDGEVLFADSNLFLDSGRELIANLIIGSTTIHTPGLYVCDLGDGSATPSPEDVDLVSYIAGASIEVFAAYPIILAGTATGVHFNFQYTASGGDKTIKELGLFWRPSSDNFPLRGTGYPGITTGVGTILARLKTTAQSIVIGDGKQITIDWKIIF